MKFTVRLCLESCNAPVAYGIMVKGNKQFLKQTCEESFVGILEDQLV
jgi:hypothetical protein